MTTRCSSPTFAYRKIQVQNLLVWILSLLEVNCIFIFHSISGLFEQSNFNPKYSPGRPNVSSEKAVLLTLWYLANRNSFREVSDRFGVSLSTAHHCLKRVLKFLISVKNQYICWPNQEQMVRNAEAFSKNNGIPGAIGAIDGSHIEIQKPKENQDSYINRKGYHSLLLQGVVDHNKRFIDVFCGEPGSLHDARLLRRSALYARNMENPGFMSDFFLLGDSAYPNLDWIITPFSDTGFLSEEQKLFNKRISSKRVVVENAFGLLKGRFRRLKGLENFDFQLCSEIILGCCILHNICQNDRMNVIEDIEENDENQPPTIPFRNNLLLQEQLRERDNRQQQIFKRMFNL